MQAHILPMDTVPAWVNAPKVSCYRDQERHFGHVLRIAGRWWAYDATHPSDEGFGFRLLGTFHDRESAIESVECSVARGGRGSCFIAAAEGMPKVDRRPPPLPRLTQPASKLRLIYARAQ